MIMLGTFFESRLFTWGRDRSAVECCTGNLVRKRMVLKRIVLKRIIHTQFLRHLTPGLLLCTLLVAPLSYGQFTTAPTIAQSAPTDFVRVGSGLEISTLLTNPTNVDVTFTFELTLTGAGSTAPSLNATDGNCTTTTATESTDGVDRVVRLINCTVGPIQPRSSFTVTNVVAGDLSIYPTLTSEVTDTGAGGVVLASFPANTLADGDTTIRGDVLTIQVVRDVFFDLDQDGFPDLDELAVGTDPVSASSFLDRDAVIDLLFLYTDTAESYLSGKMESYLARLEAVTNQIFRESGVKIKVNGTGLERIGYVNSDTTIEATLTAMDQVTDPAFLALESLVTSSGGDIVVLLNGIPALTSGDLDCAFGSIKHTGRQGDFNREYDQGRLLIAVNVGPDCRNLLHIASVLAFNMGIVPSRIDNPEGGTFSYSAGYFETDVFSTLMSRTGTQDLGTATALNRFSNSEGTCAGRVCGIDRSDVARGADAVHSLNRTRHLVSELTPSAFPVDPSAIPDKISIHSADSPDIEVTQTPILDGALLGEYADFRVTVKNTSALTLSNLTLTVSHISADKRMRTTPGTCTILGATLTSVGTTTNGVLEKNGVFSCFIDQLTAGAEQSFTYSIDTSSPLALNGASYTHQIASVNGRLESEGAVCIPVFNDFVSANAGSTVCDTIIPPVESGGDTEIDTAATPTVVGSVFSVPFIRLFDGRLISASFSISNFGQFELRLDSFAELDAQIQPTIEGFYGESGFLLIRGLVFGGSTYTVEARLVPDSNPFTFTNVTIIQTSP